MRVGGWETIVCEGGGWETSVRGWRRESVRCGVGTVRCGGDCEVWRMGELRVWRRECESVKSKAVIRVVKRMV